MTKKEAVSSINIRTSKRLQTAASLITINRTVADVGTDHAYLPIYLVINDMCENVIAMDVNKGPLKTAKGNVEYFGVTDRIELRLSNGLEKLCDNEAQSVVITGMGGELIVKILDMGKHKLSTINELVLSPQSEIFKVRKYLNDNGFCIDNESMIYEDGKYYQLLHVIKGTETEYNQYELKYGRCLIKDKNEVLKEYLKKELAKNEQVLSLISESKESEQLIRRIRELEELISEIREVLGFIC